MIASVPPPGGAVATSAHPCESVGEGDLKELAPGRAELPPGAPAVVRGEKGARIRDGAQAEANSRRYELDAVRRARRRGYLRPVSSAVDCPEDAGGAGRPAVGRRKGHRDGIGTEGVGAQRPPVATPVVGLDDPVLLNRTLAPGSDTRDDLAARGRSNGPDRIATPVVAAGKGGGRPSRTTVCGREQLVQAAAVHRAGRRGEEGYRPDLGGAEHELSRQIRRDHVHRVAHRAQPRPARATVLAPQDPEPVGRRGTCERGGSGLDRPHRRSLRGEGHDRGGAVEHGRPVVARVAGALDAPCARCRRDGLAGTRLPADVDRHEAEARRQEGHGPDRGKAQADLRPMAPGVSSPEQHLAGWGVQPFLAGLGDGPELLRSRTAAEQEAFGGGREGEICADDRSRRFCAPASPGVGRDRKNPFAARLAAGAGNEPVGWTCGGSHRVGRIEVAEARRRERRTDHPRHTERAVSSSVAPLRRVRNGCGLGRDPDADHAEDDGCGDQKGARAFILPDLPVLQLSGGLTS